MTVDLDLEQAAASWLERLGTSDHEVLDRRLAWDDTSLTSCLRRFQEPGDDAITRSLRESMHAWLTAPSIGDGLATTVPFEEVWRAVAQGAVGELWNELRPDVVEHLSAVASTSAEPTLRGGLVTDLIHRLAEIAEPVMWQEFASRRSPGRLVLAHAAAVEDGVLSRALYDDFVGDLRREGLQVVAGTHPVLLRHLCTGVAQWMSSGRELLHRLHDDRQALLDTLGVPLEATPTSVRTGLSDPHRGGRSVAVVEFRAPDGAATRIVYKPKDLRLDQAFASLVGALPAPAERDTPLKEVTVLAREGYGYMQFLEHQTAPRESALPVFYRNAGRLTAVLYLLGGSDCHFENLVACGTDLVLIDAETIFEGIPREELQFAAPTAQSDLQRRIGDSVLRLGMLPHWGFVGAGRQPRDVSALGIAPPGSPRLRRPGWCALNTDGMYAGEVEVLAQPPSSLPVGVGESNRFEDFIVDFCDGLRDQLYAVLQDKEKWLGEDGRLASFSGLRRRVIARPTWFYAWLRDEQLAPRALRSELDQRLTLEALARSYMRRIDRPNNWRQLHSEVEQMAALDVPVFEQVVDELDLELPGDRPVTDHFETSGLQAARQRVRELDSTAIDLQVRLVRGVVAAKHMRRAHVGAAESAPDVSRAARPDRAEALRTVARHVVGGAIKDVQGAAEWLGFELTEDLEHSRFGALGPSLYSGRSGISLFLASLAARPDSDSDYLWLAEGAVKDLLDGHLVRDPDLLYRWWRDQPLGLAGAGGSLLSLVLLRELMPGRRPLLEDRLDAIVTALPARLVAEDRELDVVRGVAGLIGPLLSIGGPRATELAELAGDTLVRRQDSGGGWPSTSAGGRSLIGFSHGSSGIIAALGRLDRQSPRADFHEAARRGLRYERRHHDRDRCNWPDLRGASRDSSPRFLTSWCHGSPGVALSRLCLIGTGIWDDDVPAELASALTSTVGDAAGGDSLCCGRFGRAAILRLAAEHLGDTDLLEAAEYLEDQVLSDRPASLTFGFAETQGLFTGAAGVGLALAEGRLKTARILPAVLSAGLYPRHMRTEP